MSFKRSVILILLLLSFTLYSKAQNNYVYEDSSLLFKDSIETNSIEENNTGNKDEDNENESGYVADTMLRNNNLTIEPDSLEALKKTKPFAYAKNLDSLLKDLQKKQNVNNPPESSETPWLIRILLSPVTANVFYVLACIFILFILYKLFFTEGFFHRRYAKTNVTELPEEMKDSINDADYNKLIAQALGNKNFRLAIRYHYLQALQKLAKKGVIQFAADKTNYEYVRELTGKSYKNEFASLTLHYEYVWYGEFEIDEKLFPVIQNKFKLFNNLV